ncbi:hypothetical protein ACLOJK_000962 [Asimina triloba]
MVISQLTETERTRGHEMPLEIVTPHLPSQERDLETDSLQRSQGATPLESRACSGLGSETHRPHFSRTVRNNPLDVLQENLLWF